MPVEGECPTGSSVLIPILVGAGWGKATVAWLALPSLSRGASSFPRPDIFAQLPAAACG